MSRNPFSGLSFFVAPSVSDLASLSRRQASTLHEAFARSCKPLCRPRSVAWPNVGRATKKASISAMMQSWSASTYGEQVRLYPKLHNPWPRCREARMEVSLRLAHPLASSCFGSTMSTPPTAPLKVRPNPYNGSLGLRNMAKAGVTLQRARLGLSIHTLMSPDDQEGHDILYQFGSIVDVTNCRPGD
ncbi:hypothetical protein BDV06DRAFT_89607 [Aspergillus oleicola]